jgi:hypothetical protein
VERITLSTLKADDESDGTMNGGMTRTAICRRIHLGGESGQHPVVSDPAAQSLSYDFRSGDLDEDENSKEERGRRAIAALSGISYVHVLQSTSTSLACSPWHGSRCSGLPWVS